MEPPFFFLATALASMARLFFSSSLSRRCSCSWYSFLGKSWIAIQAGLLCSLGFLFFKDAVWKQTITISLLNRIPCTWAPTPIRRRRSAPPRTSRGFIDKNFCLDLGVSDKRIDDTLPKICLQVLIRCPLHSLLLLKLFSVMEMGGIAFSMHRQHGCADT